MANDHTLRIHIEYEVLFVAEFRSLLRDFERAYNLLEREHSGRRVRRSDRLLVSTIETGNSVTLILLGGAGLVMLSDVIKKIAEARDAAWRSEETKWKARSAKLDYQERAKAIEAQSNTESSPVTQALDIVKDRIENIEKANNIQTVSIEIDGTTIQLLRPGNHIFIDGTRKIISLGKNLLPDEKKKEE
jgi:hypothetical protein